MPAEPKMDVSSNQESFETKILSDKALYEWETQEEYDAMITEITNNFISNYEITTQEDIDEVELLLQINEDNSPTPELNEIIVRTREIIGV